ncbi:MAG: PbsX family transcriptional regulator [Rhodoferax sp.]|nr:PbsX family transcriptional regulator [Rhodoferax sp.]
MQVDVVKWGNSSAVRLPAAVLRDIQVALGDRLNVHVDNGKLVLEPAAVEYRLEDLVAQITAHNRHTLVDLGAPVGREAW